MARLTLSLLGPFEATLDGEPVTAFESNRVRALLAYLAVESDRPHQRDKLAGLLWPEWPDREARSNLRYALFDLRQVIDDQNAVPPFLHISRQTIQFNNAGDTWIDAVAFEQILKAPQPPLQDLERAVELYRGEFLEGFSIGDSVPFEEWVLLKREQLHRQVLSALHRLAATHEERGEYAQALPYTWRQVELEPWQEKAHRQLMRLLALNGQRGAALAQYQACRSALVAELGVEPAQETTRLYEQIRDGALGPRQAEGTKTVPVEGTQPRRSAETAPSPTTPTRSRLAGWPVLVRRLAFAAAGLLLLAIAILEGINLFTRNTSPKAVSPGSPVSSPRSLPAPPEGKILRMCESANPPQICVYETRTGQTTQVTDALVFEHIGRLAWSPDGEQIVFNAGSFAAGASPGDQNLYIVNADGSDLWRLTDENWSDVEPVWSPDGQWIAFNRSGGLWIIRPDGSEAHKLFPESEKPCVGDLMWSPDSQQIALVGNGCAPASQTEEIWVIDRDGTVARVVYSLGLQPHLVEILWSDDGQEIFCTFGTDNGETTYVLIAASGVGEAITMDEFPYWWHPTFWPQWGGGE